VGGRCPRLRFAVEERRSSAADNSGDKRGEHIGIRIAATSAGGRPEGDIFVRAYPNERPYVSSAQVYDNKRCGIGTRLYERAARLVCDRFGQPLMSASERSAFSQGFWEKQIRKGRARCSGPATPPTWNYADDDSIEGRGECDRYVLKSCRTRSLRGTRRRRP
jgi:hypothetical protein